ncbi:protein transport protein SEC31-like [Phalaenopsis equestris]|uniref:protein transport protein SEC31-like n=1 Tax=Phalaenopsis equestris TaxID=78828 RepID=UPI0009E36729|nr:protein transport protein SEC31-like [Phalaenopsis equestris]
MGKKMESLRPLELEVKVPTFFRCPISLDVMTSPVSLCTGVTYDRSSIQRWLDSGRKTCPATNQPLPSTDLIPNLTLRHLIQIWSVSPSAASATSAAVNNSAPNTHKNFTFNLLADLRSSSSNPALLLRRLADFFLDTKSDDFEKNSIVFSGDCSAAVSSVFTQNAGDIETLEAAAKVFAAILTVDCIEENNKKIAISSLLSDLHSSVSALLSILKQSKTTDSKADAARILSAILSSSDSDSKTSIAEISDLIPELIRLINQEKMDRASIDSGIECLAAIIGVRRGRLWMVKEGVVPALVRVLKAEAHISPAATAEKAIILLEAVSGIAEGRSAICEAAEECLGAVLLRMMKVGREGMEAAVAVLWSVCHRFRDRRAVEAVAAENGGAMKILVLMQSNCSPAVRQMSGDLPHHSHPLIPTPPPQSPHHSHPLIPTPPPQSPHHSHPLIPATPPQSPHHLPPIIPATPPPIPHYPHPLIPATPPPQSPHHSHPLIPATPPQSPHHSHPLIPATSPHHSHPLPPLIPATPPSHSPHHSHPIIPATPPQSPPPSHPLIPATPPHIPHYSPPLIPATPPSHSPHHSHPIIPATPPQSPPPSHPLIPATPPHIPHHSPPLIPATPPPHSPHHSHPLIPATPPQSPPPSHPSIPATPPHSPHHSHPSIPTTPPQSPPISHPLIPITPPQSPHHSHPLIPATPPHSPHHSHPLIPVHTPPPTISPSPSPEAHLPHHHHRHHHHHHYSKHHSLPPSSAVPIPSPYLTPPFHFGSPPPVYHPYPLFPPHNPIIQPPAATPSNLPFKFTGPPPPRRYGPQVRLPQF